MERVPLYALGILRQSSVGLEVDMGDGGITSGKGWWEGKVRRGFPVWVMGNGEGGVGA